VVEGWIEEEKEEEGGGERGRRSAHHTIPYHTWDEPFHPKVHWSQAIKHRGNMMGNLPRDMAHLVSSSSSSSSSSSLGNDHDALSSNPPM